MHLCQKKDKMFWYLLLFLLWIIIAVLVGVFIISPFKQKLTLGFTLLIFSFLCGIAILAIAITTFN